MRRVKYGGSAAALSASYSKVIALGGLSDKDKWPEALKRFIEVRARVSVCGCVGGWMGGKVVWVPCSTAQAAQASCNIGVNATACQCGTVGPCRVSCGTGAVREQWRRPSGDVP